MKEIDRKDEPEVSGGYAPQDGCFPTLPGYPTSPLAPFPDPLPGKTDDLL